MVILVGAQGADRVAHMGSVQCGVPDITFQKLSPPPHSFLQTVVEIYLLQCSIPLGTFRNMILKPLTPFS